MQPPQLSGQAYLNLQRVSAVGLYERRDDVPHDKVALTPEMEPDALEACATVSSTRSPRRAVGRLNSPAPGSPMMLLLLPTRTFVLPLMTPLTTTMVGVSSFSLTAAVNCASVDTVVTVPPAPPFVLHDKRRQRHLKTVSKVILPSIQRGISQVGRVRDARSLFQPSCSRLGLSGSRRGRRQGKERCKSKELHVACSIVGRGQ